MKLLPSVFVIPTIFVRVVLGVLVKGNKALACNGRITRKSVSLVWESWIQGKGSDLASRYPLSRCLDSESKASAPPPGKFGVIWLEKDNPGFDWSRSHQIFPPSALTTTFRSIDSLSTYRIEDRSATNLRLLLSFDSPRKHSGSHLHISSIPHKRQP
jgi:hypothetical protein